MSTPLEISIALHYWTRADDYGRGNGDNNFDAPMVVFRRERMVAANLLAPTSESNRVFRPGPALEPYVKALCDVPRPARRYNHYGYTLTPLQTLWAIFVGSSLTMLFWKGVWAMVMP